MAILVRPNCYGDAVDFDVVFYGDHQAFSSFDQPGFH